MNGRLAALAPLISLGLTALMGALFAVGLYKVWSLEYRWFVVVVVAVVMVSIAMVFVARFSDFVLIALMFCIPLAGFVKWLFLDNMSSEGSGNNVYSGLLGIGLTDFLIAGLYVSWFFRIFMAKVEALPRLEKMDGFVLLVLVAYVVSIFGTDRISYGLFATEYLIKHILVYFYVSRNVKHYHIPWFILAICVAIFLEAGLGLVQHQTGRLVGIALDKGAGGEDLNWQYVVPGIEDFSRATGTSYDSHALGLFMNMLVPVPFVLIFWKRLPMELRMLLAGVLGLGMVTLLVTFSRSAWLSSVIVISIGTAVMLFLWREKQVIPGIFLAMAVVLLSTPWSVGYVFDRFAHAPIEIMTTRFEQYEVAYYMWTKFPIFGFGVGNYMVALDLYNFNLSSEELPVHNVPLYIAVESGLFGLIAFYTMILSAFLRLWRLVKEYDGLYPRMALAAIIGLFAYVLDGMTNPLFREPIVYMTFWFIMAMSVALPRLQREREEELERDRAKGGGDA